MGVWGKIRDHCSLEMTRQRKGHAYRIFLLISYTSLYLSNVVWWTIWGKRLSLERDGSGSVDLYLLRLGRYVPVRWYFGRFLVLVIILPCGLSALFFFSQDMNLQGNLIWSEQFPCSHICTVDVVQADLPYRFASVSSSSLTYLTGLLLFPFHQGSVSTDLCPWCASPNRDPRWDRTLLAGVEFHLMRIFRAASGSMDGAGFK